MVIPFFNDHTYLEDSFECLWQQSLQRIEIILVNDGSTKEATEEMQKIVSEQEEDNKRKIKVINHTKNRGLSAARNTGISKATTECTFIILLSF